MIGVTISWCLSHFRDSLIVCAIKLRRIHMPRWVWTSRRTRWRGGTLQSGVSGLSSSVRLRSVSLIRGSLVQDISIGHQQGARWLCSAASSYTEPVTLLFYRTEGPCSQTALSVPNHRHSLWTFSRTELQHNSPKLKEKPLPDPLLH